METLDSVSAMNLLSALRTSRKNELDALDLAIALLNGTWAGQYAGEQTAKAEVEKLTEQVADLSVQLTNATAPVDVPADPIIP